MTAEQRHSFGLAALLLVGAGLFGLFLFSMQSILHPVVVLIALLLLLSPSRDLPVVRGMIGVSLFLFGLWLFHELYGVLTPVIVAALIAYILDPLVDLLHRRRVPRTLAVLGVLGGALTVLVVALVLVAPALVGAVQGLDPRALIDGIGSWTTHTLVPWLTSLGIPEQDITTIVDTKITPSLDALSSTLFDSLFNVGASLLHLLSQAANLVIIPITAVYLLLDWDRIKEWVRCLFPLHQRAQASTVYHMIDDIVSAYLRGALVIASINAVVVSVLFTILGIPYGVVLGLLSGLFTLIPQFGIFITLGIAVIVSLFGPAPGLHAALVAAVLLGENVLESSVLYPRIVGNALGIHPVALIASLFVFTYFLGFFGMLVAVPLVSLLARFLEAWREARDRRDAEEQGIVSDSRPTTPLP